MNTKELVDVVDENDEVIGTADKMAVYEDGLSNRIVHVFVIHPESGEIFIQRRSATVGYLPNFYCTSAGGHVGSKESYQVAASRELEEELGLNGDLHFVEKFIYNCPDTDPPTKRFVSLYVHYAKDGITYKDGEVADGFFVSSDQLKKMIVEGTNIHPQLPPCFNSYLKSLALK